MPSADSFKTFISAYQASLRVARNVESGAERLDPRFWDFIWKTARFLRLDGEESLWLKPWSAFLLFYVLLLTRSYHWILHPQFYIEDGPEFYAIAFNQGGKTLFQIYMGYFHLIPRIIAFFVSRFPPQYGPLFMELCALAIQALTGSFLLTSRLKKQIPCVGTRALLGLLVIGYPYSNELFANVAHSQWYLAVLSVSVLCAEAGKSLFSRILDGAIVVLTSFTGPFSIILAPFALWVAKQDRRRQVLAGILTVAAITTLVSIFTHPRFGVHGKPRLSLLDRMLSNQVVIGSTLGFNHVVNVPFEPLFTWSEFAYAVFSLALIGSAIARGPLWIKGIGTIGLFSLVACLYSGGNWVMLGNGGVAERYFFFLGILFVCACFMASQVAKLATARWAFRAILLTTGIGMISNWVYAPPFMKFDYPTQIAAYDHLKKSESLKVQIPIDRKSSTASWEITLVKG